jgi:hypothetical protein
MHDLSPFQEQIRLDLPTCVLCGGCGFTGAPKAFKSDRFGNPLPDGHYFPAIGWRDGVACSCPVGREFADMQCKWLDPGSPKEITMIPLPQFQQTPALKSLEPMADIIDNWQGGVNARDRTRLDDERIRAEKKEAERVIAEWAAKRQKRLEALGHDADGGTDI